MELQALVDGAPEGATVALPPGTWKGTLLVTKGLTLQGAGPGKTVIDAQGLGPCLLVDAPGAQVKVTGVSLLNGSSPRGGGVCFQAGTLRLEDAAVEGGACQMYGGGGLLLSGQKALLVRVSVTRGVGGQGGGMLVDGECEVEAQACVFTRNAAEVGGGIRLVEAAQVRLVHCTVAGNQGRGRTPAGPEVALSGSSSRVPALELVNSVVAPTGAAAPGVLQLGAFPGVVRLSHCLLPASMQGAEGTVLRFGNPEFMPSGGHRCALGPTSPAAAAADPFRTPEGLLDLRGRPLRRGDEADAGAYAV
ncbi:MAG: hypothetical protein FJ086_05490 [Deltaproteobacteria bacterium]|nr:hypothetical protein [Deltaproteobacteria bacterium]